MPDSLRLAPGLRRRPALARTTGRWRSFVPLLVLLVLAGLLWWQWPESDGPGPIAAPPAAAPAPAVLRGYQLTGPRSAECLRLVIGLDVSGSMRDYTTARDLALAQLVSWAPLNLRPDDEIAVIDFALVAQVRLRPTAIGEAPRAEAARAVRDGRDTLLQPLLARVGEFRPTRCRVVLTLLSDAVLADLPSSEQSGIDLLRAHRVDDVRLLVPSPTIGVPATWTAGFPRAVPVRFDGLQQDRTALVIGQTLADLTDQDLQPLTVTVPTTSVTPTR
jgi:hypothetical protein